MKHPHIAILAALVLLSSCSSPLGGPDQFEIGQALAMQGQQQQAMAASAAMVGQPMAQRAPSTLQRLAPLEPIR